MKAITIHLPWATLIALGEKRFETRSWSTKYRVPIAIHAAKKVDKDICLQEPFRSVLDLHGYTADNLPTGAIVATCRLNDCLPITFPGGDEIIAYGGETGHKWIRIDGHERLYGWFEPGRYGWEMAEVKRIDPVPAKGQQGLWNWGGERDARRT
ncbi:ASCH domain-containing protein [uncultured Brevibacillus sp.]|uniref:ASCH domain-containing protein n=1 Tax=uncultured Brevibacillus sp. TaxID=169970 RepID=UPI00259348ED|nr:ASCH domain-containing protein [uncultured Brevibacillus sp.]